MGNLNLAWVLAAVTVLRVASGMSRDYVSDVQTVASGFSTAVASWNVVTPQGSWIETQ